MPRLPRLKRGMPEGDLVGITVDLRETADPGEEDLRDFNLCPVVDAAAQLEAAVLRRPDRHLGANVHGPALSEQVRIPEHYRVSRRLDRRPCLMCFDHVRFKIGERQVQTKRAAPAHAAEQRPFPG